MKFISREELPVEDGVAIGISLDNLSDLRTHHTSGDIEESIVDFRIVALVFKRLRVIAFR